ncbi:hypothetical protein C0J52_23111 [Blattella germanica]|nr:hypothetical protein C0J52_23111 [Blattella germanica]
MRLALFIAVTQSALTSHHKKIVLKVGKCTGQKLDANVVQLVCRTKLCVLLVVLLAFIGEALSICFYCDPDRCPNINEDECVKSGKNYYPPTMCICCREGCCPTCA